jgi:hypothetical protein
MNEWAPDSIAPKRKNAVVRQLGDEFLVYDLKTNKAHCLNRMAGEVWMLCDGKTTVAEITRKLRNDCDSFVDETVIEVALSRLQKAGLMEQGSSKSEQIVTSRRAALRKVMATAALALPVVASIRVPTAAQPVSPQRGQKQRPARRPGP